MAETKNVNKVIYGGQVLIDLTSDTVNPATLKRGATAHDASGVVITGTNDNDVNSADATAQVAEILVGKTAYARGVKLTGTMPQHVAKTEYIEDADQHISIPQGYHDGSGKVAIDETEKAKLIPANIREGVTVLGITGTMTGTEAEKKQSKEVTPTVDGFTVLPDSGYTCLTEVEVKPIPYAIAQNAAGGYTVTIA